MDEAVSLGPSSNTELNGGLDVELAPESLQEIARKQRTQDKIIEYRLEADNNHNIKSE